MLLSTAAILRDSPGTSCVTTHEVASSVNTAILGGQIKPPTYPFSPPSEGPSGPRKLDSSPQAMAYHHSRFSPIGSQNQTFLPFRLVHSEGFLTKMFGRRDAAFFIGTLFKVNSRNLYLVGNMPEYLSGLMVQSPSNLDARADAIRPDNQPLWLLDMIAQPMYQVVPQKMWTPPNQSDWHRYVEQASLHLPVFFIQNDGAAGLPLVRALAGDTASLRGANMPAPLGGGHSTQIRIAWPGYDSWERQIQIRDQTRQRNEITLERFAKVVSGVVDRFLTDASSTATPDGPWRVGHAGITRDNVFIVGAVQVSAGGWMPILQVNIPPIVTSTH